jgi:hypothetical protein
MALISRNVIKKQPDEKIKVAMEFGNWITSSETLSDPIVTYSPSGDLTVANISISGSQVQFFISGGVNGKNYRFQVEVDTSSSEILQGDGLLKVRG